ncbi:Plant self-incompatibility S1 [Macleaya cordata]|uniref:S-protein homolog n=1 Tax=Macleaya cordata TaxID=56857 RepID=A0A200QRP8_MACCD|nr:Plant self-incompatibility S1 [Macleaya cordata]
MTIHCKSKDDDLGEHNIHFNENYTWRFHDNIDQTTLFWCKIGYWDNKAGKLVMGSFDIYKSSRDNPVCAFNCIRYVKTDGIYFYIPSAEKARLIYPWPK